MSYQYTPFDPIVWLIFSGLLVCIVLVVKVFQYRYPNYPESTERDDG
jgi:hypothetical protein